MAPKRLLSSPSQSPQSRHVKIASALQRVDELKPDLSIAQL
jgi:hypothetical protein